ncbi:MAG: hypothetical protein LBN33_09635 [Desulfovibrio sp.]|jgi:hypothetical protein|nr:hypothetical protein [Desulfovibrio sp.]
MNKRLVVLVGVMALIVSACGRTEIEQTEIHPDVNTAEKAPPGQLDTHPEPQAGICKNTDYSSAADFLEILAINTKGFEQYPEDVKCFVEYAATCEHFAGEEGYDDERQKFLQDALHEYCPEAKKQQVLLKKKYEKNENILKVLAICDEGSSAVCVYDVKD